MAWKVTAVDVRMAAALAQGVEDVAGFCRAQGISRQTYYKWKKRFELEVVQRSRNTTEHRQNMIAHQNRHREAMQGPPLQCRGTRYA